MAGRVSDSEMSSMPNSKRRRSASATPCTSKRRRSPSATPTNAKRSYFTNNNNSPVAILTSAGQSPTADNFRSDEMFEVNTATTSGMSSGNSQTASAKNINDMVDLSRKMLKLKVGSSNKKRLLIKRNLDSYSESEKNQQEASSTNMEALSQKSENYCDCFKNKLDVTDEV